MNDSSLGLLYLIVVKLLFFNDRGGTSEFFFSYKLFNLELDFVERDWPILSLFGAGDSRDGLIWLLSDNRLLEQSVA